VDRSLHPDYGAPVVGKELAGGPLYYGIETVASSGRLRDEPPAETTYCPGSHCQSSLRVSKVAILSGSMGIVTVLRSPAFR
jgi:hypothetical protein